MGVAQQTIVWERRKDGELLTAQHIGELMLENVLMGHRIRRGQLDGVESHSTPRSIIV